MVEFQTSGGETIGILKKLKDEMSADLANSQKADEEEQKTDHALTRRREDLLQGETEEWGGGRHADGDHRDEPPTGSF